MKKLLSFGTCLALGLSVVGTSAALADSGKYYFDNSVTNWEAVNVWAWTSDEMWALDNGFEGWPGLALEKDADTGYYVYDCADVVDGDMNIMFNANGAEQLCDLAASECKVGCVFVPSAKNTADDEAANEKRKADQWYGEWKELGASSDASGDAAADGSEAGDATTETPAAETPAAETPAEETPAAETPAEETTGTAAGKTADAAPIAAVAMLGLVSMAVVVATRKKIA